METLHLTKVGPRELLHEAAGRVTSDQATLLMRPRDEAQAWCAGGVAASGNSVHELLKLRDSSSIIPVCFRLDYDEALRYVWQPAWMVEVTGEAVRYSGEEIPGFSTLGSGAEFGSEPPIETDCFPLELWTPAVEKIREEIGAGFIRKAVLSRQVELVGMQSWSVHELITRLLKHSTGTSVYAHAFRDDKIWLGATPEVLFQREGRMVKVDSLAGTRQTILEGNSFSAKDRAEQQVVTDFVKTCLEPLCEHLTVTPLGERRADELEHVYCQLVGVLKAGVTDDDLLAVLHPTPAVCGTPRDLASELIRELEPRPRELYSGVLGYSTGHTTLAVVVLRCAMLNENHARLYGGAGIVADSNAEQEYAECGWKMDVMRRVLLDQV
ncbi:MAG: chorismate-binding protein [Calditrichaeota bacterium]|nr:chorismate-binding protein [Calditrichota bacterium]